MNINWALRFKNKVTLTAVVVQVIAIVYAVLGMAGIVPKIGENVILDIAYMLIPNKILLFFLPLLVIGRIVSPLEPWWDSLLGATVGFSTLLLIAVVSKGGMGGGDIKLFFLIGLVLGTIHTLLTLFLASVVGMIVGMIVLKVRGQGRKTPVPFGPSIAVGALIAYFYGEQLIEWYWQLF